MDHLSTMKRKNVVFVYDLLLEMLDANTSPSPSTSTSTSPSTSSSGDMASPSSTSDASSHQPGGPDHQGSGESAMGTSPEQSTLLGHAQDLQGPPPPEAQGACAAMEGDG